MNRAARWARWSVLGTAIVLLLWVGAAIGGWSPEIRRLTINVHGPAVADYRAESPLNLAPLSPDVTSDASRDQAAASRGQKAKPTPSGSASTSPSATGGSPSGPPLPTLPLSTPTLPVATPTATLPTATPTAVPTLPTPPPLP